MRAVCDVLRLNQHLELHDVTDNGRKRAFLLSCLDPNIFSLFQNLFGYAKVTDQAIQLLLKSFQVTLNLQSTFKLLDIRLTTVKCRLVKHIQTG